MMIPLVLLFAQVDPLPPPPPPDPGQPFESATPPPPPRPRSIPDPYMKPSRPEPTPMPRRGFQLGIRSGVALPGGKLADNTAMAALASAQIPLFVDLGAKVSRYVFLGGYASFGLGGVSDRWKRNECRADSCGSQGGHVGAQIQLHLGSFERTNPWLGYGIGYEWLWTSGSPETVHSGPEYGRFMAGVDFRLSREWGLGPFVDATVASYRDTDAVHSWVTVGLRLVLFP